MSTWKQRFESPVVLAAAVASLTTLCITLVTAGSALWTAHIQSVTDIEKSKRDTRRILLIEAFKQYLPEKQLLSYIESGVLEDNDCKLRTAILHVPDCKPKA